MRPNKEAQAYEEGAPKSVAPRRPGTAQLASLYVYVYIYIYIHTHVYTDS